MDENPYTLSIQVSQHMCQAHSNLDCREWRRDGKEIECKDNTGAMANDFIIKADHLNDFFAQMTV